MWQTLSTPTLNMRCIYTLRGILLECRYANASEVCNFIQTVIWGHSGDKIILFPESGQILLSLSFVPSWSHANKDFVWSLHRRDRASSELLSYWHHSPEGTLRTYALAHVALCGEFCSSAGISATNS